MVNVLTELAARRRRIPFEPFAIVLRDGRRLVVSRKFQYGLTEERIVVLDERDLHNFLRPADIVDLETPHPVG